MNKYIGTYRVFQAIYDNGKVSANNDDTYLKCKYNSQIYRYDDKTLAIYFVATNTVNNIIPQLEKLNIKLTKHIEGDSESVYLFAEKDLSAVASIIKPQTKGKNIQAKSIKTARRQQK